MNTLQSKKQSESILFWNLILNLRMKLRIIFNDALNVMRFNGLLLNIFCNFYNHKNKFCDLNCSYF